MSKINLTPVFIIIIAALAFLTDCYHSNATEYKKQRDDKVNELKTANATITDMTIRQRDVAALDAKYTKELADAQSETDALRRRLDAGGRVLVRGKCPMSAATQTARPARMGHDATVELSPAAGRNVLGIRGGIISDQAKIKYLQDYIKTQCVP
ncbi:lysis protein [Hafnia alvei]|uniref:Prophage endopeptidase n=1 Tax=Hafnia alvei TaxID=569 RepID=A0A1C6YX20_HAFAL|nr:lysis protein [Hafnia alvei]NLS53876.1 lysis protein [Hafnia alvei]SCM51422.1 prophage endopeptidase [Hafnia alvei]